MLRLALFLIFSLLLLWVLDYNVNTLPLTMPKNVDLTNKVYVVTGCSMDSIGFEIAKALKQYNAKVVCVMRDKTKSEAVKKYLDKEVINRGEFSYELADFSSLKSVVKLVERLESQVKAIDGLILNAGAMMEPLKITEDGFDELFQINHLAQFLLLRKLLPKLVPTSSRVVLVSSLAAWGGKIDRQALSSKPVQRNKVSNDLYSDSKLMNILVANELHRRHQQITSFSVDPGIVATGFQAKMGDAPEKGIFTFLSQTIGRTPLQG